MSAPIDLPEFSRKAVEPVACIKAGWSLIRNQYWLFVGLSVVGVLIGSVVPFGILMGPMMCGIYLVLLEHMRGRPIEFGMLFKGFDYFVESLIATLLQFVSCPHPVASGKGARRCLTIFSDSAFAGRPDHCPEVRFGLGFRKFVQHIARGPRLAQIQFHKFLRR